MSLEDSVERVRDLLVKRMGGKSYLRQKGLIEAISSDLGESALTVRQCLGRLARQSWLEGVSPEGIPFAQVKIIGYVPAAPVDPNHQRWLGVMTDKGIVARDMDALAPLSAKLADFTESDMTHILDGLLQLRYNLPDESGQHRFLVSAKYLLGSSKLLDVLPSLALRAFGITIELFPNHPLYVVVAGCASPRTVVLVENPAAFELAVTTAAIESCAFIATFGFGLSKASEDFGNQLVGMVEQHFLNAVTLVREGSKTPSVKELFAHPNITFWGDLDTAGMQIYERLAKHLPAIQLSALYEPMIEAVTLSNNRHPYVAAVGKSGQSTFQTNRDDSLMMLDYCREWAVDQEFVTAEQIVRLACKRLLVRSRKN
uniref:Wadjet protein JetD C-terminal domain-containing protein n=1 Tax=mine drainage metagenome TaxID=410659 RepID=E6QVM9_9ZZZZ